MKKKKHIILVIISLIILLLSALFVFMYIKDKEEKELMERIKAEQEKKMAALVANYNKYVVTTDEVFLYKKNEDIYEEIGKVNAGVELTLGEVELNVDVDYFPIEMMDDNYYIKYEYVIPIDNLSSIDYRYKKYIVFNKNIVTDDEVSLYKSDTYSFVLNKSFDFPVVYKDGEKIYVEYAGELYYVLNEDVVREYDNNNTNVIPKKKVRTLVYHRIYNPDVEKCNQVICHKESDFDAQIKYLSDNGYLSLTMKELELFIDGNLQIPEKSIVITIDDGTMDKRAVPILEKYKINATLFLVTSRFKEQDYIDFTSDYLELHSHTHNMHWAGECAGYGSQGGGILCLPENRVLEDLKASREKLNGSTVFCYPFYDYSNRAINLLKEAGFTMAFAGVMSTGGYSYVGTNKMLIPRLTLNAYTTYKQFVSYVN